MNRYSIIFAAFLLMLVSASAYSQTKPVKSAETKPGLTVKSTAAYAELMLRRADVDADLVDMLADYTEEYPKVKELRFEAEFLKAELENLQKIDPAQFPKLTEGYAQLILRKIKTQTDLAILKTIHKDEHPDVQRMSRRLLIYERTLREFLQ